MSKRSNIAWTKSTFNPWIGCTKVGQGCDHCYAAVSTPARAMKIKWGAGEQRHRTSEQNWNQVRRWNAQAPNTEFAGRKGFWPVFCASLADVFDNEVLQAWRDDLFALIEDTPNLSWLLVTKRISNVAKMVPERWMREGFPAHVRIMITVVNQAEADRDVARLLALPCKNGISYEPALGLVDWSPWTIADDLPGIQWIIIGGESSQGGATARPFDIEWARGTVRQYKAAAVPVFVKQLGGNAIHDCIPEGSDEKYTRHFIKLKDRAGADPAEWPADLQVQEFPA